MTYNNFVKAVDRLKAQAQAINKKSKNLHVECYVITRINKKYV